MPYFYLLPNLLPYICPPYRVLLYMPVLLGPVICHNPHETASSRIVTSHSEGYPCRGAYNCACSIKAFLQASKASCCCLVSCQTTFFLVSFCRGCINTARCGMKVLQYPKSPKKGCSCSLWLVQEIAGLFAGPSLVFP